MLVIDLAAFGESAQVGPAIVNPSELVTLFDEQ